MESREPLTAESRERQHAAHAGARHAQLPKYLLVEYLPLLALLTGILLILTPIWQPGYPWGTDSWGHLQRAAYMGRHIREHGLLQGFADSAWMSAWYMGDPMRVYYPPLTTWILGPLTALVGDVFVAYRLLVTAIFVILSLSVYHIGCAWGRNRWLAAAGALMSVIAPYTLHTVFAEGNLPRGLALLTLPWLVWYSELVLRKKVTHWMFAALAGLWALAIVAHVMQATIFAVAIGLYVILRVLGDVYVPVRRGILALVPVALGGGIAAAYLLPAYGKFELANVPSLPGEKIDLFSITPASLLPYHDNIEAISLGLAGVLLAIFLAFYTSRSHQKLLLAIGLLCILLAFGPASGVFQLIPLNQSLLPERFLNASMIFLPLVIATTPPYRWKLRWVVSALALVILIDFVPAWRVVHMREAAPDIQALAEQLGTNTSFTGRIAQLTFPNPTAQQIYLTGELGGRDSVLGWALENTPHQDALRRLLAGMERAPAYVERMLSLWNTDYLMTRFESSRLNEAAQANLSFRPIGESGAYGLWERTRPSFFVQELTDRRMLIIGSNATSWLFAFPFASEGESADPSTYSAEYLAHFSVIGLNRIAENAHIEAALGDWVRQGSTLIVDLSGLGSIYDQGFTLFGVHAIPLSLNDNYVIHWPDELDTMPPTLPFQSADGPWVGATYYDLDVTVASLSHGGQDYPLLGYQNVGRGRVWFVSFNLFYLLDLTGQYAERDALVNYLLALTDVNRDLTLPALDVTSLQREGSRITFRYSSASPTDAVISQTYFPRWQAKVDGQPLEIRSHEHLMLVTLPAGTHAVTLEFQPYSGPIFWLGWGLSAVFTGATAAVTLLMRKRAPLSAEERSHTFDDRLPQPGPATPTMSLYAPCPNCEFPFAIEGPPNENTYPFISLECPVCGFVLDSAGMVEGNPPQDASKRDLVDAWLKKSNISEGQLVALFGIHHLDELFAAENPPQNSDES